MMKRKIIDWELIENQYRLGQKSMRTIAAEYGVDVSGVSRRAKKHGWIQDKSFEVQQRTNAALVAQQDRNTPTREDIDVAVMSNVQVIREHRKSIGEGRCLVATLFAQLKVSVGNRDVIESDIYSETQETHDKKTDLKRRNTMLKSVALPANAGVLRDLSTALKNLIGLEREAFNLNDTEPVDDSNSFLKHKCHPAIQDMLDNPDDYTPPVDE